jgi:hypothetical protein
MSKIQINSLQAVGSELFESGESFVTELEATEANAIYGGKKGSGRGSRRRSGRGSRGRSGRGSRGRSGRGLDGNIIVIVPFPFTFFH